MKYPRFTPASVETHPIVGKIKIYEFNRFPSTNGDGCQSSFFRNGAKVNTLDEFGIKIFNTSVEAFAAYQRQKIAAKAKLAPPVGVMVRWIIRSKKGTVNRWGYETGIADISSKSVRLAMLRANPLADEDYRNFMRGFAPSSTLYTPHSVNVYWEMVDEHFIELGYSLHSVNDDLGHTQGSLCERLSKLNIVGTQYDDISGVDSYGNEAWENKRLRLGEKINTRDDMYMGGDLHEGNVGLWNGNVVAIDFGYHCACSYYRYSPDEFTRSIEYAAQIITIGRTLRERYTQLAA